MIEAIAGLAVLGLLIGGTAALAFMAWSRIWRGYW